MNVLMTIQFGAGNRRPVDFLEYSVDGTTGLISFAVPPAIGVQVTAGFEFDVPVRFDTDRIQTSVQSFQAGDVPNVPIVEVRV